MEKKNYILLFLQIAAIAVSGVFGGDTTFALITALIGITFNFLVSMNIASGFLFGFVYAVCNGILAWQANVYATFVFMIFMQAPMALYSFWKWHGKKKETEAIMKKMNRRELTFMIVGAIVLFAIMAGILSAVNGALNANVLFDTFFFVCSVTACIGLAACYKNAYIVNLGSGIGGTILWLYKAITMGTGISMAVFFVIVALNSALAVHQQYGKAAGKVKSGLKNLRISVITR